MQVVRGRAELLSSKKVRVAGGQEYETERVLIPTGSRPSTPEIQGSELLCFSDDLFHLPKLPRRMVILGGGYIAVEFAGIFQTGVHVSLCVRGELPLRGFDQDVRNFFFQQMQHAGVDLRLQRQVTRLERIGEGLRCHLDDGSIVDSDRVLAATDVFPTPRA